MLGWIPMAQLNSDEHHWSGCLTLPRKLKLCESGLLSSTAILPDYALRNSICDNYDISIKENEKLEFNGDTIMLQMGVNKLTEGIIQFKLKASKDGKLYTSLMFDAKKGRVELDWSNAGEPKSEKSQFNNSVFNFSNLAFNEPSITKSPATIRAPLKSETSRCWFRLTVLPVLLDKDDLILSS